MPVTRFLENVYSFRKSDLIFGSIFHPRTPDQAALADIESQLVEANNQFVARKYDDAINSYQNTKSLIYAQIDPGFLGNVSNVAFIPSEPSLFTPLLSSSLEWMNTLPVQQTVPSVRPRVTVELVPTPATPGFNKTGLMSSQAATQAAVNTIADWQMARSLQDKGFNNTAQFFLDRAGKSDPALLKNLNAPAGHEGGRAIAAAAQPAAAVTIAASVAPGLNFSEFSGSVQRAAIPSAVAEGRTLGVLVDNQAVLFGWQTGAAPPLQEIQKSVYASRISLKSLPDVLLYPLLPSDFALSLPHAYYYTIPLGLAECYHALGDFATAEGYYFGAASYQFLNAAVEAHYVWQRLATLYLDWGNSLFLEDDPVSALSVYSKVLLPNGTEPASTLYTTVSLKPGADQGRAVIANLNNLANITAFGLNPVTAAIVIEIHHQLLKIENGLDFWGFYGATVPIWTFDYLQSVASSFAQLAITAERDVINFFDRADQGSLTRQQLSQGVQQCQAEVQASLLQAQAAQAEASAYAAAKALADQRTVDAKNNATDYSNTSALAIQYSALQVQTGGGDDGDPRYLNQLADQLLSGHSLSDISSATLSATNALVASRLNRQYEVAALGRQAAEMQTASAQAAAEVTAASARVAAANAATAVASLRAQAAQQNLDTFDSQIFTPDVWYQMGDQMVRLYRRYLTMAQRAARLMQQAYNFETDQNLKIVKGDYSSDEVKGLLAADSLMADIQSFTYDLITSTAGKPQPLKQTISLAQQYGFLFETQFRKTGSMQFETRIEDFDDYYPGIYAGRIDSVEVAVDGIVPVTGISGQLTNSGISSYRLPASLAPPGSSGIKFRVQSKETLILSDYSARQDVLLSPEDQRRLRVFEGAGLASSWRLDLPKGINDIDYGALTDVRLTFCYKARFDPDLRDVVLAQLAGLPGANQRQRSIPIRWVYPDAFFRFQDTGDLKITLRQRDFRSNETQPVITSIGILLTTDRVVSPANLVVSLGTPTLAAIAATTDATGAISSDAGAWVPLASGTALGDYVISMKAANNPQLVSGAALSLAPIVNIGLLFGYSFTPKS